jgi:hypothetical protein
MRTYGKEDTFGMYARFRQLWRTAAERRRHTAQGRERSADGASSILANIKKEEYQAVVFHAARDGDTVTARTLLSTAGAQSWINYQHENGATPLSIAACNGHASVTEQLIKSRCNIELQTKNGPTPLYFAAHQGHASITKQLIEARCDIDVTSRSRFDAAEAASLFMSVTLPRQRHCLCPSLAVTAVTLPRQRHCLCPGARAHTHTHTREVRHRDIERER